MLEVRVRMDGRKVRLRRAALAVTFFVVLVGLPRVCAAFGNEFDKTEQFLDKINLEQSIAAVLQKVAYGSTTKRSIPDTAYPVTTLATPLLTTYRYSDGSDEYFRVDVKGNGNNGAGSDSVPPRINIDYGEDDNYDTGIGGGYGSDLERDHVLPTSAPAADILKNNNNPNYENPNRYKNDRVKPFAETAPAVTNERTTTLNPLRNVRPTKSIYSKDVPSYVPPSRAFFTPPLPPEFQNPFADKPTLRGTNSDSYVNRRPIPPPSLMPNKDRIPFRPDLPPSKVINMERTLAAPSMEQSTNKNTDDKKKSLNTPSQSVNLDKLGEFYGLNRQHHNETSFEYEKGYIPSITRILSGSNGRHDEIPDVLLRSVTATPPAAGGSTKHETPPMSVSNDDETKSNGPNIQSGNKVKTRTPVFVEDLVGGEKTPLDTPPVQQEEKRKHHHHHHGGRKEEPTESPPSAAGGGDTGVMRSESITDNNRKTETKQQEESLTTQSSELNLPKVIVNQNMTQASKDEIWFIAWRVHVYLAVLCYILLALFSIFKLVRYENDPHMFTRSYFLTIHLMLTVICVLRIFYLTYDPYNVSRSFNVFLYDFLHNFPLSLLATTFTILIQFLLKHTLTHLKVKTRPVFLVMFSLLHIVLCLTSSILETFEYFDKASLIFCKTIFVLLAWSLGMSYLYLYRIIKNVLAKKSQQQSSEENSSARTSYASHITIAVALLFILLGAVQLYALLFIKIDRFDGQIKYHWILWSFELSVRLIEISIITLLVIVVSLRLSQQREKQMVGFPLFPCTGSETSSQNDNMYPNNCNTNPNAMTYSRQELQFEATPTAAIANGHVTQLDHQQQQQQQQPRTLDRNDFKCFERPKWGSDRSTSTNTVAPPSAHFDRLSTNSSSSGAGRKAYQDGARYFKYQQQQQQQHPENPYSEPVDHAYERTRHEFERRNSRNSSSSNSNASGGTGGGRRSTTTGRSRNKAAHHQHPHQMPGSGARMGTQTLPGRGGCDLKPSNVTETMIVDEKGFVRFRHMHHDPDDVQVPRPIVRGAGLHDAHYSDNA